MDRRQTLLVMVALMTATFITALDIMVVGTVMPTIIGQLGGLPLYTWVFTAYLLTSTVTVPIYGKLADLFGRLPVFFTGVVIFLIGSALCGLAQSMEQLVVFRAIQGLGAGAVQPLVITMVGDLFSIEQRARFSALFGAVWGFSSVIGPFIGGTLTEAVSWRFVFYVNIPVGVIACLLLARYYPERTVHRARSIDFPGAVLLTLGLTGMLLALAPGHAGAGIELGAFLMLAVPSAALLVAFVKVESRAKEPILPLELFKIPAITVGAVVVLLSSAAQFGLTSFIPLWEQGVQGGSPTMAGLLLVPLSVCWSAGSFAGGKVILRYGFRPCLLAGVGCILAGCAPLPAINPTWPLWLVGGLSAVVGLGLGFTSLATTVATQNSVGWERRGVATSTNLFARTVGGAIGITLLGTLLTTRLAERITQAGISLPGTADGSVLNLANAILEPSLRSALPADALLVLQAALSDALGPVFTGAALFGAAACIAALKFPAMTASGLAAEQTQRSDASVGPGVHR